MSSESAARAAAEIRTVIGRLRRRLKELDESDDLTPSRTSVLIRLDRDGPASASELAAAEHVRPQSMAAIVSSLLELDLVQRHPDPNDGRRQLISLTSAARRRLQGERRTRQEWLAGALETTCTEEERQTIMAALAVLHRVVDATGEATRR